MLGGADSWLTLQKQHRRQIDLPPKLNRISSAKQSHLKGYFKSIPIKTILFGTNLSISKKNKNYN